MNWLALAQLLYTIFGPIIEKWLKKLFEEQGEAFGRFPPTTAQAITQYFAAARSRLGWFDWRARRRLNLLERLANRHISQFAAALRYGHAAPKLSEGELEELADTL